MSKPARNPQFSSAGSSRTRVTLRDLAKSVDFEAPTPELPDIKQESYDLQLCAAGARDHFLRQGFQAVMRNADPDQEIQRPKQRTFLLIRRPVHRPGRMHRKPVKTSGWDNRAVPVIIIFSSFLALALLYLAVL